MRGRGALTIVTSSRGGVIPGIDTVSGSDRSGTHVSTIRRGSGVLENFGFGPVGIWMPPPSGKSWEPETCFSRPPWVISRTQTGDGCSYSEARWSSTGTAKERPAIQGRRPLRRTRPGGGLIREQGGQSNQIRFSCFSSLFEVKRRWLGSHVASRSFEVAVALGPSRCRSQRDGAVKELTPRQGGPGHSCYRRRLPRAPKSGRPKRSGGLSSARSPQWGGHTAQLEPWMTASDTAV